MKKIILFVIVMSVIMYVGYLFNERLDEEIRRVAVSEIEENKLAEEKMMEGFEKIDLATGSGSEAKAGKTIVVDYRGTLKSTGKEFDSSYKRGQAFEFILGSGQVIKGWELGIEGMKVGGKRRLTIPPALAYGDRGAGADIPPDSTLIFDVHLLEVK